MTDAPGLYLHLPFCRILCPYCDFSVLIGDEERRARFVGSLLREIELCAQGCWPAFAGETPVQGFDTIYLGGGTPSLLASEQLERILATIERRLPLERDPWLALEANPEDVNARSLESWKRLGVRFLSLGIQSLDDRHLRFLGRGHDASMSRASVSLAGESGVETVSIDLIYGLPGQTAEDWRRVLEAAVALRPDHLSCYQLTMEAGTPFGFRQRRGELTELSPGDQAELFFLTHAILADHGFEAYEVSNFASAPEHRSRHNSKYWQHTPYLGLGPSAHSFAGHHRWWNERKIRPYEARLRAAERPIHESEHVTPAQLCLERLMLGLRTPSGVDFDALPDDLGPLLWASNRTLVDTLIERRLVGAEPRRLRPTLAGMAVAEAIARDFEIPGHVARVC